ncbi:MAG: Xaa-Pro peptidase family protein [Candidatus Altiarchaeota archaeon]|nr:Xaa-Pro peptidase family protein [Candidatus Altiarchaeota archaeon]
MDYNRELGLRVKAVQRRLRDERIPALIVSSRENIRYLTGKETGRVVVTRDGAFLWVKDLYKKLYSRLYSGRGYPLEVSLYEKDSVRKFVRGRRMKKVAVDNSGLLYGGLRKELNAKLLLKNFVLEQRAVKSPYEIGLVKRSCSIASLGMRTAEKVVKSGVREIDAVAEIEKTIRVLGSETPPFDDGMLLAAGVRSADIHAKASCSRIRGGLVVVDLGATFMGYHSDMTRTLSVGRLSAREKELSDFVRDLRDEAIDYLEVGMKASEVHRKVEDAIRRKGFSFYHSAGHGVGLQIHEAPSISPESNEVLKENMVFTIEPGIYVPGRFGVRFEDTVVLTGNGARKLTR